MSNFWGYMLSLDCSNADYDMIRSGDNIAKFSEDLVKRIDMEAYGPPQVVHFGEDNKKGYTLVQLISTSNICGHFVEDNNSYYLDVFSCKSFDIQIVIDCCREYFGNDSERIHYFVRQA